MGFGQLFSREPKRFWSEKAHSANLARQVGGAPKVVDQLRRLGVAADRALKLEYTFYTDTQAKAQALAGELSDLGYEVRSGAANGAPHRQIVTGWTTPIMIEPSVVSSWAGQMCDLGFHHDAEFDGWGTNPAQ